MTGGWRSLLWGLFFGLACSAATGIEAKDYGHAGTTWKIAEPDMLEVIRARLMHLQQSGEMAKFQDRAIATAQESVRRPKPVAGITHAGEDRDFVYDPTITIGEDIRDGRGNIVAAKGQKFNPLEHLSLPHDLVFIDGDSKSEIDWAMKQGDPLKVWIVMVKGSPLDRMKELKRRFFFDQQGEMTSKFGILHTPALVKQRGTVLDIRERVINRSADL